MSAEKKKTGKGEVVKYILGAIGVAGILVVAVAAPNALQIIPAFKRQKRYSKKSLDRALATLLRKGLVRFERGRYGRRIALTEQGRQELSLYEMRQKMLKRPKRWDKQWRVLLFDIEEKRKGVREAIRKTLVGFGFYRLQDSVWVYPHECEEVLELLRTKYRVRHEALYMRVNFIANDTELRRHFGLPT